jgi:hypothetical protein
VSELEDAIRTKLRAEVMAVGWAELAPQFARGGLLFIDAALDLLDVATAIARDQREQVEAWLAQGQLWRAGEADAHAFASASSQRFQCVIVQPWVLAQALGSGEPAKA